MMKHLVFVLLLGGCCIMARGEEDEPNTPSSFPFPRVPGPREACGQKMWKELQERNARYLEDCESSRNCDYEYCLKQAPGEPYSRHYCKARVLKEYLSCGKRNVELLKTDETFQERLRACEGESAVRFRDKYEEPVFVSPKPGIDRDLREPTRPPVYPF